MLDAESRVRGFIRWAINKVRGRFVHNVLGCDLRYFTGDAKNCLPVVTVHFVKGDANTKCPGTSGTHRDVSAMST